jgi:hypothetical protein
MNAKLSRIAGDYVPHLHTQFDGVNLAMNETNHHLCPSEHRLHLLQMRFHGVALRMILGIVTS